MTTTFIGALAVEARGVALASTRGETLADKVIGKLRPTECFASVECETLAQCAEVCLYDGVLELHRETTWHDAVEVVNPNCTAFAYNAGSQRCVRLGPGVDHLLFTPYLKNFSSHRGWMNFRLRKVADESPGLAESPENDTFTEDPQRDARGRASAGSYRRTPSRNRLSLQAWR